MKNFIIYRVACTVQLLVFFFVTMITLNPQANYTCFAEDDPCTGIPNTFSLPVIALVTITLLNDGTLISVAYDNVTVAKEPEKWNLTVYFTVAFVQGGVAFISSVVLLLLGLNNMDAENPQVLLSAFGIPRWSYGEVLTAVWLKVSISDYLTLWGARTNSYVWSRRPGKLLTGAFVLATSVSTLLGAYWFLNLSDAEGSENTIPNMKSLPWAAVAWIWGFNIAFFVLQEIAKILTYQGFEYYYSFKAPDQQNYTGQFLTDSFLVFTTGYATKDGKHTIVTRRSIVAAHQDVKS